MVIRAWAFVGVGALLVAALILGVVAAQNGDDAVPGLDDARARWDENGPESYRLTYDVLAMIGVSAATATVIDGEITEFEVAADESFKPRQWTVPALFDEIDDVDDANRIQWHPELGYPIEAWFDPRVDATDDEWRLRIMSLEPIE